MDAAEVIYVCERGHADDGHFNGGTDMCSRCGGQTFPFSLDALAKFAIERNRLFAEIDGEITYLERLAERNKARCHQETAQRLQKRRDSARVL